MPETHQDYVNRQILEIWQQLLQNSRARAQIVDLIKGNFTLLQGLRERVRALEERAGVNTEDLAQTKLEVDLVAKNLDALATDLQNTKDVIDLDDIEKGLAAQGIASTSRRRTIPPKL